MGDAESSNSFFEKYKQEKIKIRQYTGLSPLFFPKLRIMGALFAAPYSVINQWVPFKNIRPLCLKKKIGLVMLQCLQYQESDIGPYNEIALSIILRTPNLFKSLTDQELNAYVQQLPVTTQVALFGGLDYFNFPKFLADISFRETKSQWICTAREPQSKNLILEVEGDRLKQKEKTKTLTLNTFSKKDSTLIQGQMKLCLKKWNTSYLLPRIHLRSGKSSLSTDFESFYSWIPLQYLYAEEAQGVLFMPKQTPEGAT